MEMIEKTIEKCEKIYFGNAFSLNMLQTSETLIRVKEVDKEEVKRYIEEKEVISAIGHVSTALVLSRLLEKEIKANRIEIKLSKNDKLIVFQLTKRLGEGQILNESELNEIIENKMYKFYLVEVI